MNAALVPGNSAVGDVLRVDTDQDVDGIVVTAVLPSRTPREEPERLELIGSGETHPGVTTTLATRKGKRPRDRSREDDRSGLRRRNSEGRQQDRVEGKHSAKKGRKRRKAHVGDESEKERSPEVGKSRDRASSKRMTDQDKSGGRPSQTPKTQRENRGTKSRALGSSAPPRAKRLRPKRSHRNAALADLPEEQQRIAGILLQSGIPGLRNAIDAQNQTAREAAEPEIPTELLLRVAENIHPRLRDADWLDRAEAAVNGVDKVDLRDLRAVVVASENAARSNESRSLADELRTALTARVEREHNKWVNEVSQAIDENRGVRALRLSSRPPKAGAPLPEPILARLTEMANTALSSEVNQSRWGTLLDAVALSPVHQRVVPAGLPLEPGGELLDLVRRLSTQTPQIATLFGVEPTTRPRRRARRSAARP